MTDVRRVTAAEFDAWVRQMSIGFHFELATGFAQYYFETVDLDRTWGAFDGNRVVGTLRSVASSITAPGPSAVTASALTNVTVAPTHRRRGLLRAMITKDLAASVDRAEPLAILIASEYPIYGRYGFGPATEIARYSVDTRATMFHSAPAGTVELADRTVLREVGPALYDRFRSSQPGAIERPAHWWDRVTQSVDVPGDEPAKGHVALYRSPEGELEGYVRYEGTQDWDAMRPQGTLNLQELLSVTPAAHHALWSFLCGIDLLTTIDAPLRPTDELLPLLLEDGRVVKLTSRADFVWVRVLDVPAALATRRYATSGRLVLEVTDPMGIAGGRFELDGGPDGARCERTTASPDLTLTVDALGSAYLGGIAVRTLALAGRVSEHRAGAVGTADAMLRTGRAPWCSTWF